MAVMKQAILGLHSSKNSHSPLTRKIAGNHGQKSRHRTLAVENASTHGANRPKPTIFVSGNNYYYLLTVFVYCMKKGDVQ